MKAVPSLVYSVALMAAQGVVAAISMGPSGALITFDTQPFATEWAGGSMAGSSATFVTTAELDSAVQNVSAAVVTNRLPLAASIPPSPGVTARWNSNGHFTQTRPDGVGALLMMATLRNNTGANLQSLYVHYDFTAGPESSFVEDIPGYRVYYSLTGLAGDWTVIPQLSGLTSNDAHGALIGLGNPLMADALLYLLWVDDNSSAGIEPYATIDNFFAGSFVCDSFYWLQPFSDITIVEGQRTSFSIDLCPHERFAFQWSKNNVAIPGATDHTIHFPRVQLTDGGTYHATLDGSMQSRRATLTVTPDDESPRAVRAYLLEDTDAKLDAIVVSFSERVETNSAGAVINYRLHGNVISNPPLFVLEANATNETNVVLLVDSLAEGVRYFLTISNVTDQSAALNLLSPNPTTIEVETFQPLISASHTWKYFEAPANTNWLGWTEADFDDTTWPAGWAAFGFPNSEVLPAPYAVQTDIRCASCGGPNTTYFRTHFALTAARTNSIMQLSGVFDDGAVVYLNGQELWRVRLPAGVLTTSTFATNSYEPHLLDGPVEFYTPGLLRAGMNTLAVEVHQSSTVNGDVFMGLTMKLSRGVLLPRLNISQNGPNTVSVNWTAGGTLQVSPTIGGLPESWQDVMTETNRFTTNVTNGALFFRVRP